MEHVNKKPRVSPEPDEVDTDNPMPADVPPTLKNLIGPAENCFLHIIDGFSMLELFKHVKSVCKVWQIFDARNRLILYERCPEPVIPMRFLALKARWPRLLSEEELQRYALPWTFSPDSVQANFQSITHLTICKERLDREYFGKLAEILKNFEQRLTRLDVYWIEWSDTDADFVMSAMNSLFEAIGKLGALTHLELFLRLPEGNYEGLKVTIPSTVTFLRLEIDADYEGKWLCSTLERLVKTNPKIKEIYSYFNLGHLSQIDPTVATKFTKLAVRMANRFKLEKRVRYFSRFPSVKFLRMDYVYIKRICQSHLLSGIHALGRLEHVDIDLRGTDFFRDTYDEEELPPALSVRKLTVSATRADIICQIMPLQLFPNMIECEVSMACAESNVNRFISTLERLFRNSPQMKELTVNGRSISLTGEAEQNR